MDFTLLEKYLSLALKSILERLWELVTKFLRNFFRQPNLKKLSTS